MSFIGFDFTVERYDLGNNEATAASPSSKEADSAQWPPELQPPATPDQRSHSPSFWAQAENSIPKLKRHVWTSEEKAVLCVLYRWFVNWDTGTTEAASLSHANIHRLMVLYFKNREQTGDPLKDLKPSAVHMQLYQNMKDANKSEAWRSVYQVPFLDHHNVWRPVRENILRLIEQDGLEVMLRPKPGEFENSSDVQNAQSIAHERSHSTQNSRLRSTTKSKSPTTEHHEPSAGRAIADSKNFNHLIDGQQRRGQTFGNHKLGYRFFNENSQGINTRNGFWSGRFAGYHVPPPNIRTEAFRSKAEKHLRWEPTPTSFISLRSSLLNVINKALVLGENAHVSVIDLEVIEREQDLNGENRRLHRASDVIKEWNIGADESGRIPYKGTGEWIVWEFIESEAVIATFAIDDFLQYVQGTNPLLYHILSIDVLEDALYRREYMRPLNAAHYQMSFDVGKAVGKLLAFIHLPELYLRSVSKRIATAWNLVAVEPPEQYYFGAELGYMIQARNEESDVEYDLEAEFPKQSFPTLLTSAPTITEEPFLEHKQTTHREQNLVSSQTAQLVRRSFPLMINEQAERTQQLKRRQTEENSKYVKKRRSEGRPRFLGLLPIQRPQISNVVFPPKCSLVESVQGIEMEQDENTSSNAQQLGSNSNIEFSDLAKPTESIKVEADKDSFKICRNHIISVLKIPNHRP